MHDATRESVSQSRSSTCCRRTVYHQFGKGRKRVLRFSKRGDVNLEAAYSRHYLKQTKLPAKQAGEEASKQHEALNQKEPLRE